MALLTEIADAWVYTVRARMGLFAHYDLEQHAAAGNGSGGGVGGDHGANGNSTSGVNGGSDDGHAAAYAEAEAVVDAIRAHHLWTAFMWEVRGAFVHGWMVGWMAAARLVHISPQRSTHRPALLSCRCRTVPPEQVGEQHRHELSSMRGEVVEVLWRLYSHSLADAASLTAHPASTGARFRLLHVALRYCRAQQAAAHGKPCPLPVVLLYEQVQWLCVGGL